MATIPNPDPKPNPTPPQPVPPDPADPISPTPTRICATDFIVSAAGDVFKSARLGAMLVLCGSMLVLSAITPTRAQPYPEQPCAVDKGDESPQALNEKLGNCKGVLKPPHVGDAEIAVEPPAVNSEMPVVKPGELPDKS